MVGNCLDCKNYKSSFGNPKICEAGFQNDMELFWETEGFKVPSETKNMNCFEAHKVLETLTESNISMAKMLKELKELKRIKNKG